MARAVYICRKGTLAFRFAFQLSHIIEEAPFDRSRYLPEENICTLSGASYYFCTLEGIFSCLFFFDITRTSKLRSFLVYIMQEHGVSNSICTIHIGYHATLFIFSRVKQQYSRYRSTALICIVHVRCADTSTVAVTPRCI